MSKISAIGPLSPVSIFVSAFEPRTEVLLVDLEEEHRSARNGAEGSGESEKA